MPRSTAAVNLSDRLVGAADRLQRLRPENAEVGPDRGGRGLIASRAARTSAPCPAAIIAGPWSPRKVARRSLGPRRVRHFSASPSRRRDPRTTTPPHRRRSIADPPLGRQPRSWRTNGVTATAPATLATGVIMMLARSGSVSRCAGLAEVEMGSELGRQPRQGRRRLAAPPGSRRLGGEHLLGEVGEQWTVGTVRSAIGVPAYGTRARAAKATATAHPPVRCEQHVDRRQRLVRVRCHRAARRSPRRERQLGGGDLRRQPLDDQPGSWERERSSRRQHDVEMLRRVANDGGDQLRRRSIRTEDVGIVDDQDDFALGGLGGDKAAEGGAEGIGPRRVVVRGKRREGVGRHRQLGVRHRRLVTETVDQRAHRCRPRTRRASPCATRRAVDAAHCAIERRLAGTRTGDDRRQSVVEDCLVETTQQPFAEDRWSTCGRTTYRPWSGHRSQYRG